MPPHINYRIIELDSDKIKYGNPTEGVFRVIGIKKDNSIADLRIQIKKKGDSVSVPLFQYLVYEKIKNQAAHAIHK